MFSKWFGSKKEAARDSINANCSFLQTDMHSHLIPGIDDGAQTIEDSLELIKEFQKLGYTGIVTTPHIKSDYYPNDSAIINNGLQELRQALHQANIQFPVRAAAEYYVDERFIELLDSSSLLTVYNNEVLIEFSFSFEPMHIADILFRMQTKGYTPIIAHPERYVYYHQKFQVYREFKDRGCLLQLNALSITGYYGRSIKEVAEKLLLEKLYDYCGTDMHHLRHAEGLRNLAGSKAFAALREYPFRNRNIRLV
ncbi:MAG: histidinol phosphatase [Bacteroidetes bacterium]|nr:histidinol phosphatase [Bacteroidota bacterium]